MSQDDFYINGELLRLGREARGWVIGDMATRACMSVKQIRQLEEGGTSAFYSPAVKMTSAKKLAGILELSAEQVFKRPGEVEAAAVLLQAVEADTEHSADQSALTEEVAPTKPAAVIATTAPVDALASEAVVAEAPKGRTSVWAIAALFVAAIGVAAYMKQQEEPVTEPPPPLQVMPAEVEPAANAASAADAAASNASVVSEPATGPVTGAPVVPASGSLPAAVPAPAAPKPAASAASKPL